MTYFDIDPSDLDPETGQPYANYSSPSLDASFHDHEMDVGEDPDPVSLAGFTRRVFVENDQFSIFGYIRPDVATDGVFKMWDQDNSEWLSINGWQFEVIDDDAPREDPLAEARAFGLTAL